MNTHVFSLNVVEKFKLFPLALQAKLLQVLPLLLFEDPLLLLCLHLAPTHADSWRRHTHGCQRRQHRMTMATA